MPTSAGSRPRPLASAPSCAPPVALPEVRQPIDCHRAPICGSLWPVRLPRGRKILGGMAVASALPLLVAPIPAHAAGAGPALTIDATASHHLISPDIYGMNFADPQLAGELRMSVDRWGGNS